MATPFVPYNPGTITVTNGSVNFTGSGTMLTAYEVGDAIIVDGNLCRIATIASNTAGTFALDYPGTTGSGKVYDWYPASDVTRALTLYASFQRLLVGGNLAALSALDGTGGNKFPRLTGAGTMDVRTAAQLLSDIGAQPSDADLTAIAALATTSFGRSLLTLADAAAGRTALGAQASLGYTPVNKAGDSATGVIRMTPYPVLDASPDTTYATGNGSHRIPMNVQSYNVGFTPALSNAQFVCTVAGRYKFTWQPILLADVPDTGIFAAEIRKNGSLIREVYASVNLYRNPCFAERIIDMAVNDYVEFWVTLTGLSGNPYIEAYRSICSGEMIA